MKFNFRLAAVEKLRDFATYRELLALGRINQKIVHAEEELARLHQEIDTEFLLEEQTCRTVAHGLQLRSLLVHMGNVEGNRLMIKRWEAELAKLQAEFEAQLNIYREKKNSSKLIKKVKEKKFEQFRKEQNRQELHQIEEMVTLRLGHGQE